MVFATLFLIPVPAKPISQSQIKYVDLLPKVTSERFPDRSGEVLAYRVALIPPAPPAAPQQPTLPTNDYKQFIYNAESGNNPWAINASSGACGLGQALPCSKMGCNLGDYVCQDAWFTQYCYERYGSWYNAYVWWVNHKWW